MENIKLILQNKRARLIIIVFTLFIVITVTISVILMAMRTKMASEEASHGAGDEVNATAVYFENRYLLDYTIGKTHDSEVLTNIEEFVLEENDTAPEENTPIDGERENLITGTIEEEGFKKLKDQPQYTYRFYFNTSDGRRYTIYARTDENYGQDYVVTVIDRTDKNASSDRIYINTNDEASYKDMLVEWGETFNLNSPKVIVNSLSDSGT